MSTRPIFIALVLVNAGVFIGSYCQKPTPWQPVCPSECVCFAIGDASVRGMDSYGTYMNCSRRRQGPFPVGEVPEDTVALDLSFNEMGGIPAGAFDKILKLKRILLEGNHLSGDNVSPGVFYPLKHLDTIYLSLNNFSAIPQDMPDSIKHWYFASNAINYVSRTDLQRYPHLETLQLSNNKIKYLPMGMFAKQTNMTELQVSSNNLTNTGVPNGVFKDAINLKHLELARNQLTRVPRALPRTLETLDLAVNNITRLYVGDFEGHSHLEYILLDLNRITEIDSGAFSGLDNIISLSLSENHLTHLHDGMFEGLPNLELLTLFGNKIISMSDDVFVPLMNLQTVDLDSNSLETLQYEVLYNPPFKNLTGFYIGYNPWNCDCRVRWLRELFDLKPHLMFLPGLIKCAQPPDLKNMSWDILFPQDFVC